MKPIGMISAAALLLLFGAVAPSYAIQDQHEQEAKPPKQEPQAKPEKQEEAKPPKQESQAKPEKQQEAKPPKQESQAKPEKQQAPKAAKQEPQAKPEKQQQAKAAKPAPQAKPEKQEQAKAVKPERQAKPEKQQEAKTEKPAHEQPAKAQHEQQAKPGNQQHAQRTEAEQQRQRSVPALRLSARSNARIPDDRFRSNFGEGHRFVINEPVIVGGYSRFQYSGFWFGFVQPWPDGWYYTDDVYVDYIDGEYFLINPYYPGARVGISVIL
jgi:hypothetical protein